MYSAIILTLLLISSICTNAFPNVFEKCISGTTSDKLLKCITLKTLDNFKKIQNQDIYVGSGITLKKNLSTLREAKSLDLNIDFNNSTNLLELLSESASNFITSRSLSVDIPLNFSTTTIARAFEEGRGKMKKMMGPLLLGFGTKMMMTMLPLVFGVLVFFTTKALLVGKLALIISVILFIETFMHGRPPPFGGSFGIPPTYGVPQPTYGVNFGTNSLGGSWGTSGQYPYSRSLRINENEES